IEFAELVDKQLAGREGDERELLDRGAVLLLRRPQNGEMDEIHRGIGLEEVAPGALAGMRLARNEEDAQPVADAVDDRNGMVVLLGDLARERVGDDLGDVLAAMIDHYRQGYALAGVDFEPLRLAIAHMDIDADRRAATACILDPEAQRLLL